MGLGKVIGRVAIKVLPDTTEFRERTANDLRRIEKQLGDLEVDVIPEIDQAAKNALKAELKKLARDVSPLKVKVDLDLNNGDIAKVATGLKALTHQRKVQIAPELDNGAVAKVAAGLSAMSGLRYTLGLFRNFRNELMNLDKAVPKIGVVSHAVAGLGAWVLGVSGNLFSLSTSLAQVGGAGLALPGIFGGIAVGLGVTIAALKDFNKQVPQASRYVKQLQDTISKNFWDQAAKPIRELVDNLFPILNKALVGTSTSLGKFFGALSTSVQNKLLPSLAPMFDKLSESIDIASTYTDYFVGIIEKLGSLGAAYLPRLATWFGELAKSFDGWLAAMAAPVPMFGWVESAAGINGLTAMIDVGILRLKELASIVGSVASIIGSLGAAAEAAGGATVSSLAKGLADVADAAASPAFQSGLTDTLRAAYEMMNQISSIAGPALENFIVTMSERFQSLAPTIGDTIGTAIEAIASALSQPAVTEGLTAMFEGFNEMVHSLAPAMDPLAQKFAVMGELIGTLASNIGQVMAALIQSMAPVFVGIVQALLPVIDMLGPILTDVIKALGPVFETLGSKLADAAGALEPMVKAFKKLLDLLLPILVPVLDVIVGILGDALVAVINGVTWVIEGLIKVVDGVIDVFKGFGDILAGLFTLDFGRMWDGLKQVFSGLGKILVGALQAALGAVWAYLNGTVLGFFKKFAVKLLGPVAGPLGKFFKPLIDAGSKVWGFLKTIWGKISGLFKGGGGGGIKEAITKPFQQAVAVVRGAFGVLKTIVKTAWTVIKTIFGVYVKVIATVLKTGWKVLSTVIKTYFTVWKTIITTAWKIISKVFETAITVVRTIVVNGWNGIKSFFSTTMDGLYYIFRGPWDAIANFMLGLTNTIKAGLMLAWDGIKLYFTTVFTYLRTLFELGWAAIKTATTAIWGAVRSTIVGAWESIKLLVSEAIAFVSDLVTVGWSLIKSASFEVWNAIKGVISTAWNAIKSVVSTVVTAVKSAISTAWNAIKSATSATWDAIKTAIRNAWDAVKNLINGALGTIKGAISGAWGSIKSTTSSAWESVRSTVAGAWGRIKSAVTEGISDVIAKVKSLPAKAINALAGIGTALYQAGKDLIAGFVKGIKDSIGDAVNAVKDGAGSIIKGAKGVLKIKSPSRVFMEIGDFVMQGLARGIKERGSYVEQVMRSALVIPDLSSDASLAGDALGDGFVSGLAGARAQILSGITSLAEEIAEAMRIVLDQSFNIAVRGERPATVEPIPSVALERRLGGLERQVTTAARANLSAANSASQPESIRIDNITIPLEDLEQLRSLEEFMELLRVRLRQG